MIKLNLGNNILLLKKKIVLFLIYGRYLFHRYIIKKLFKSYQVNFGLLSVVFKLKNSFFGYYNLSPENVNGLVLCCESEKNKDHIKIHLLNGDKTKETITTKAWNWQQGCMLQWSYNHSNIFYYNDYSQYSNHYVTKVYDINKNKIVDELPIPICCIAKDETYALSLNFERLALMRPDYGYFCNKNVSLPDNKNDGIWKIDLKTKEISLIITLKRLIDLNTVETMKDAEHKVNHIDIAPNSKRFMFLHRWVGPQGRFMRLITSDSDGNNLFILNGDKMTSHSCWWGNDKIISFCHTSEFNNSYVVFDDLTHEKKLMSEKLPTFDGHPSVSPDGKWMITDSYPELDRMSKLFLYNIKNDDFKCLGRFYQPLKYVGKDRIDLHPKWNLNGSKVYIESGHDGQRKLYQIDLSNFIKEYER